MEQGKISLALQFGNIDLNPKTVQWGQKLAKRCKNFVHRS